jgi:predicted oxidoreductase
MSELPQVPTTRLLGKSGIVTSSMAWGMWRFAGRSVAEARALVDAALESGITLFDTADIYGFKGPGDGFGDAEALLGQVFADSPALRDRMVLATKGGITPPTPYDSSPGYLEAAIDASLKRFGVHRIDLYQVHRPDILTHPHEVARAMEKAYALGKIGAFGVSNVTPAQMAAMVAFMPRELPLSTTQPELSPLCLTTIEDGTLDLAMMHNQAVLAWSPLGGGRIANPTNARETAVAAALDEVATAHSVSRTAAAYAWIMAHPAHPIPIVGSQDVARIKESADAFKVRWTRESWYKVLVASRGAPLP